MLRNSIMWLRKTVSDTQEILCQMFLQSDLAKDFFRKAERHVLAEARIYSARKGFMRAKHFRGYFLRRDIVIVRRTPAQSRKGEETGANLQKFTRCL
jgi:hypothetical protein